MNSDCFYYGTYSPDGFYSLASRQMFRAEKNYYLKCYSFSSKQKLFELIKKELEKRNYEYIDFCIGEKSIGVFSESAGFKIVDGTYAEETPDGEIFCIDVTKQSENFESCVRRREEACKRIKRFGSVCRCISNDMMRLDYINADIGKMNRYASRLWHSTGGKLKGKVGTEHERLVTCITSDGVAFNPKAFDIYCKKIIVICDCSGACSKYIVQRLRNYALSSGYDVVSCLCPLNPEEGAEHIIVPELKLGIFACKYFHKCNFENGYKISANRFLLPSASDTKKRMDFSFKAYRKLMREVFSSVGEIEKCDKMLDLIADKQNADEKSGKILQKLFST